MKQLIECPKIISTQRILRVSQTMNLAALKIMAGQEDAVVAGGVESMSMVPLGGLRYLPSNRMAVDHPDYLTNMGLTAENLVERDGITREQQDEFAFHSHRKALAAIEAPQDCVREMVKTYDTRRRIIHEGLNAIDGIQCLKPESTFYAFPNISSFGLSSWEFAEYLVKEHKVAVVPGRIFGKAGEGYVRLSFAASIEQLTEGIARIRRGVEALQS